MKIFDLIKGVVFESDKYEFKKKLNNKNKKGWLKTVCGFSNSNGGYFYIGVDDEDKTISAFNESEVDTIKQTINNSIIDNITPIPKYNITAIKADGGYIIELEVYKNNKGITFLRDRQVGNQIFVRRDGQTTFALPEEIQLLAQNMKRYEYDETILGIKRENVTFDRLNEEYEKVNNGENITDKLLVSFGLVTQDSYLTVAGLLFSDYDTYENSKINFTVWPDNDKGSREFLDSKQYKGNLLNILYETIESIEHVPYYMFGGRKTDTRRVDIGSFSYLSLREALVNAIAHRDYTIDGNDIAVDCFKDRIEITSPGSMLQGTTIGYQRIDENTASQRRNSVICNVLEKLKLMDNKGSGFSRIVSDYSELDDSYAPLYRATNVTFTIRLANKRTPISNKNYTTSITASKNYLDNNLLFKSQATIINENPNNGIIINMIESDKTTDYDSIAETLDITRDGAKYYITKLREAGIVRREGTPRYGHYEILKDLDRPAYFMNLDEETKQVLVSWCKKYFKPSHTVFDSKTSYGLKHTFEGDTGIYVTNGQFKGAMLLAGFKPQDILELNWKFKISDKSPAIYM